MSDGLGGRGVAAAGVGRAPERQHGSSVLAVPATPTAWKHHPGRRPQAHAATKCERSLRQRHPDGDALLHCTAAAGRRRRLACMSSSRFSTRPRKSTAGRPWSSNRHVVCASMCSSSQPKRRLQQPCLHDGTMGRAGGGGCWRKQSSRLAGAAPAWQAGHAATLPARPCGELQVLFRGFPRVAAHHCPACGSCPPSAADGKTGMPAAAPRASSHTHGGAWSLPPCPHRLQRRTIPGCLLVARFSPMLCPPHGSLCQALGSVA